MADEADSIEGVGENGDEWDTLYVNAPVGGLEAGVDGYYALLGAETAATAGRGDGHRAIDSFNWLPLSLYAPAPLDGASTSFSCCVSGIMAVLLATGVAAAGVDFTFFFDDFASAGMIFFLVGSTKVGALYEAVAVDGTFTERFNKVNTFCGAGRMAGVSTAFEVFFDFVLFLTRLAGIVTQSSSVA
jgi:hypothetical protein